MVGHPFQNYDAFLPRIIVYNRYVWAFIPYTTIYIVYIRVFNTRIGAKSNARLYALLKTRIYAYLSKPTYTRAKMCIHPFQLRLLPWTMFHSLQCTMVNPFVAGSSVLFKFIEIWRPFVRRRTRGFLSHMAAKILKHERAEEFYF